MSSPECLSFFATAALGTEALLLAELQQWGALQVQETRGGVRFQGPLEMGYRACLWSRIANRVLLPLKTFPAPDAEALYEGVQSIDWEDHLSVQSTFAVDSSTSQSLMQHSHFIALKAKDAIVDQLRARCGERPSVKTHQPDVQIHVYLHRDQATVSLDLSGEALYRRGYRGAGIAAPLKENLAAAILMLAGWPRSSEEACLDPMCGSGTLLIEAASMALNQAPGMQRDYFGFLGWQGHVPRLWQRLLEEARDLKNSSHLKKIPKIIGYDRDFRAVRVALEGLEKAGLRGKVHIEKRNLAQCMPVTSQGIWVVNPPYGERLGTVDALQSVYQEMGDTLKKRFSGWEAFILTGSRPLAQAIHLKPSRRWVLWNGPIECRLLKYEMYSSTCLGQEG